MVIMDSRVVASETIVTLMQRFFGSVFVYGVSGEIEYFFLDRYRIFLPVAKFDTIIRNDIQFPHRWWYKFHAMHYQNE